MMKIPDFEPRRFTLADSTVWIDDVSRLGLIPCTPEETVRQRVLHLLIERLGYRQEEVETETWIDGHPSHSGRADIIITVWNRKKTACLLSAIVECKRLDMVVSEDDTWQQVLRYSDNEYRRLSKAGHQIKKRVTAITMDEYIHVRLFDSHERSWRDLSKFPRRSEIMQNRALKSARAKESFQRDPWKNLANPNSRGQIMRRWAEREDVIPMLDDRQTAHLIDLSGLLQDQSSTLDLPCSFANYTIAEDIGMRKIARGNASGGQWPGDYRSFKVIRKGGGDALVGLALLSGYSGTGTTPYNYLIVAVDRGTYKHNSLQLNVDKDCDFTENECTWRHSGRLSFGRGGSIPRQEVLARVAQELPGLVQGNWVVLGRLPIDSRVTWSRFRPMLARIVAYACLRSDMRRPHQ